MVQSQSLCLSNLPKTPTLQIMNEKVQTPEIIPAGADLEQQTRYFRRAVMMSVAVQVAVELAPDDPARFTSDIFDTLPSEVVTKMSDAFKVMYPGDSYPPNRLMKFINDDEQLESWLTAARQDDTAIFGLSLDGIAKMNEIYSAMLEFSDSEEVRSDWMIHDCVVQQTAPRNNSY